MGRLCYRGKAVYRKRVDFSLIALAGNGTSFFEAKYSSYHFIKPLDLVVVAVKKRQERGLCAGCALDSSEGKLLKSIFGFLQVHRKLIAPQHCPFADGGQLRRLKMRKAQRGQQPVPLGELAQQVYHRC